MGLAIGHGCLTSLRVWTANDIRRSSNFRREVSVQVLYEFLPVIGWADSGF